MLRQAAIVSYQDLKNYFAGNSWGFQVQDDGSINAKSDAYDIRLHQKPTSYDVQISAIDDPSDASSDITDDPVKFISKFLSTGTEADDLLKRMSFVPDPKLIAGICRRAAMMLDVSPNGSGRVKRILRRAALAAHGPGLERLLMAVVRAVAGEGDEAAEVTKLTKDMKSKGWKVSQDEDDKGRPVLKIDVSGIYEAEIRAKDTVWSYSFQVNDIPESKEEGTTDDPIQKFRVYYKKDSTQEFKQKLKDQRSSVNEDPGATAAPGKAPKKPGKKNDQPSEDGTEKTLMAPTQLPPSGKTHNISPTNQWSD